MDLAVVGVGVLVTGNGETRLAFASVGPTPMRTPQAEEILSGSPFESSGLQQAVRSVMEEIQPVSDIRASREYRAAMTPLLLRRALDTVKNRLANQGISKE
jgi:carbon-monoxide dehydrogenase medium subunit